MPWLIIYGMADFAYLMLGLVMLVMGVKVWDGSPQAPFLVPFFILFLEKLTSRGRYTSFSQMCFSRNR